MNFFEHQDDARRSTRRLVILFILAVVCLIVITNVAIIASLWFFDASIFQKQQVYTEGVQRLDYNARSIESFLQYLDLGLISKISFTVVSIIALVIFFKRSELSGGGKVIATRLGGRLISPDTQDAQERVILNVVEEMSIASGTAVPPVYLLPEMGINAFAAGFNPNDAVIGISKGAVQHLNREQLQGVVAHEFSHIFNGDMRLNINLIAVLAGILFIGHSGWFVVRMFGGTRVRRSSRNSGSALIIVGFLLVVIGYIGSFFGNLIKAAVSRQREFLADASAVQFTRNPEGIAGALKLIGGSGFGSRMQAAHTEEMSHMFFSNALNNSLANGINSMFATHPPLEQRIQRIEPRWNGKYLKTSNEDSMDTQAARSESAQNLSSEELSKGMSQKEKFINIASSAVAVSHLAQSVDHIGEPDEQSYQQAHEHLDAISQTIKDAVHRLPGAKALMYLLLLDTQKDSRVKQQNYLNSQEDDETKKEILALYKAVQEMPKNERLDLVELAIPALKTMSKEAYDDFLKHLVFLLKSDNTIDLFEWLLHSLLVHYLKPHFYKVKPKKAKYRNLSRLRNECKFLLSYLTYFGEQNAVQDKQHVFASGFNSLELGETHIVAQEQLHLRDLNNALNHFSYLFPLVKPRLLKACALCIQADGHVSLEQFELLRVIAALLDCPMPLMELAPTNE